MAATAAAPLGGGPDSPASCLPDFSYGSELILAHITSDQGESAVHAYYGGCDHNGFDDGTALRALTGDAVQPLVAAPNTPLSWGGPAAKRRILLPEGQLTGPNLYRVGAARSQPILRVGLGGRGGWVPRWTPPGSSRATGG